MGKAGDIMDHSYSVESVVKIYTSTPANADVSTGRGLLGISRDSNKLHYVKRNLSNQLVWQNVNFTPDTPPVQSLTYSVLPKTGGCEGSYIELLTYVPNQQYTANITVDPAVVVIADGTQLHIWDTVPNINFTGRYWQGQINTGNTGAIMFKPTETRKYLTVMVRNPVSENYWDTVYFTVLSVVDNTINIRIGNGGASPF